MATTTEKYSATAIYTAGSTVTVNGVTYKANYWVSGTDPSQHNGTSSSGEPWTIISGGPTNPAYSATAVYTAGQTVTFNGVIYKANYWVQGKDPSKNNGVANTGQPWTVVSGATTTPPVVTPPVVTPPVVTPPVVTPPVVTPSTVTPPVTSTTDPLVYSATAIYTAGQLVTYNGNTYKANWWVSGDDPATHNGGLSSGQPWTLIGPTKITAPNAPINLVLTGETNTAVGLSWASGGGLPTSYIIFQNGVQVATTKDTAIAINGLKPGTTYNFSVEAVNAQGVSPNTTSLTTTTLTAPPAGPVFSPYVDMTLNPGENIVQMAATAGLKALTMAFVQSNGKGGVGWAGIDSIANDSFPNGNSVLADVKGLQAALVKVTISFGGAAGIDPALVATSAAQLQAEYQSVIDRYGVKSLDFDIEGAAIDNVAANKLRDQALKALEAANPGLEVIYTVPVLPQGLVDNGLNLLKQAKADGVRIDIVNIMTMDYGTTVDNGGKMGQNAIDAIKATEAQLNNLGMQSTKIGATALIGVNDIVSEVFTLADAQQLASYAATDSRVAELSMWSLNRDNGTGAGSPTSNATNSSISQTLFQFASILGGHKQN